MVQVGVKSLRRTLQVRNGGKFLGGVLCKSKMEENFFAAYSANPKWTQKGPNCRRQLCAMPRFRYSYRKY
jgi:hypothetical protein